MAAPKKRKAEQDAGRSLPNQDTDTNLNHTPVKYIRQPDDNAGAGPSESDEDYEDEEEDFGKLLEPLSNDQLITLLVSAAARDPATLSEIHALADVDPSHRKLFVHGLDWNTTSDGLSAAFSRYGEIVESRVVFDRSTARSKGYGFILFRHRSSARRALREPRKLIDTRMASCQLASNGPTTPNPNTSNNHNPNLNPSHGDSLNRKIYVGNVHSDIDGRRLHAFFSQYGEIEEGPLGFDRHTGKSKGFAIFLYKTPEGAKKALEEPSKNFEGHHLVIQKATDSHKAKISAPVSNDAGGSAVIAPNVPPSYVGYNGSVYGGQVAQSDMGMAQHAALLGQGLLGQAMPGNAAVLAMLAAAGQNQAAFGITPAMLASLNPALAMALAAGAAPAALPQAAGAMSQQQGTVPIPGYPSAGSGYRHIGFQGPSAFQGSPGYQSAPGLLGNTPQVGAHHRGNTGHTAVQRSSMGSMSGYGLH
ncbi:UBP1-associated protein 2B-like [Phalaenopsis equestris]|uniref:UBP1-associated protein 2B-like n=1 Tax=Phalaenopsis equestris TaxID=78828 RepID=UPI0009E37F45|nr:UBP1-associated protein 2B-like [Phalaenopsis equestris]XP_020580953.1 UBP1-associated protein 2B-like [Phalaenopsis equestris]XP_020580954.1 UBP1-associated protein 2B-like [Phalaenopsis equestris]XP_020580955.1 UBP1-associated protein 2B-like [Phalaenopsis equestris]XP_020580958.1 UBP1-associated protein 2B-like [Phalaenopsis equestris]XP_020580959.1 UBP1-associated protein 2B-like [Phalaenopsis equestris]XP_020580960.1 UBP1-associated protein 2B-like [Phalaenopsis equestris]XP_02058096